RASQVLTGVVLSAGLVWFGFLVTGTRVDALTGGPGPGGLTPLPGSEATHTTVLLDGQPTLVSDCTAASPPEVVPEASADLPAADARRTGLPFIAQRQPDGGALVWTAPDGRRRAVLVEADPLGRARYRLLEAALPRGASTQRLPGGLTTPPGLEVVLSLQRP